MLFWYFPFILLHFLVCFLRFLRFCGLFLSIRYAFCYIPCSCFAHFTCFFNFMLVSLHFAISCFAILRSCGLSFQLAISCSHLAGFMQTQWFHVILRHFGFTLVCCVVQDHEQAGKLDSQCPPGKIISALRFAQLLPRWLTHVYFIPGYVHFIFQD